MHAEPSSCSQKWGFPWWASGTRRLARCWCGCRRQRSRRLLQMGAAAALAAAAAVSAGAAGAEGSTAAAVPAAWAEAVAEVTWAAPAAAAVWAVRALPAAAQKAQPMATVRHHRRSSSSRQRPSSAEAQGALLPAHLEPWGMTSTSSHGWQGCSGCATLTASSKRSFRCRWDGQGAGGYGCDMGERGTATCCSMWRGSAINRHTHMSSQP